MVIPQYFVHRFKVSVESFLAIVTLSRSKRLNWGAQPYIHGNCDENGICHTGIFVIQSFVISGRIVIWKAGQCRVPTVYTTTCLKFKSSFVM